MVTSAKKLGQNMKKIRLAKQMSQGDICRKLGLGRSYISNVESGKNNPTLSTITKLAQALGVKIEELIK
ncbi:MAG: DNA-binding protein [Candidatus Zambryskibacteria bacterium RIFCSPHIGHO2_12_FULL_38_37]|uniref:DNA-binding protein n=2 Tax=Candidatus Zambryskiibacteriota TaxID=1817925 RepID=A0A1G2USG7_9BACT|nr:MAG: DNA-binding protein [Candidatus Zambryskibacteria bacterium RIFCSPHIGHO2_12_FULL_38_37]OHB12288.1 MAG: DNA-binding protein [Candidatus Zambryskibacteria bacterium RIFCSPLOWO2_12_39_8]